MSEATPLASVVLVGRTNVGKSTIFNRLVGGGRAIVSPEPGTTRDRNRALVTWRGSTIMLEDTGGLDPTADDPAGAATAAQAQRAGRQAALVLFVVDGRTGLTAADREMAKIIRRLHKPTILVVNKVDNPHQRTEAQTIELGFPNTVLVSGLNGTGTGDLLDIILSKLEVREEPAKPTLRVALVGKTNVGKSSLFNALLGDERSIVLPTPHTTRDAVREQMDVAGVQLELIDTAGLRRQMLKATKLEQLSTHQTLAALEEVDVAILVVDGSSDPTWQDQRLGQLVEEAGVAALVLINKADLVPQLKREYILTRLTRWLPMLDWAVALWVSAKTGRDVTKVMPAARTAAATWGRELSQEEMVKFSTFLKRAKTTRDLPLGAFKQTGAKPPSFVLELRTKENIPMGVAGWIGRELRNRCGLWGVPVRVRLEGLRKKN